MRLDPSTKEHEVLRRSGEMAIDSGYLSIPEPIEFPTENGRTAHAFVYSPKNRDYAAPDGELPPLLVMSHGGPTAATSTALDCPVIFFQGLEDEVVPKEQAETMFAALRDKDLPVAYVPFEGEQHGFRRAENIRRALDGELYFYSRVFGFGLANPVEPVPMENL